MANKRKTEGAERETLLKDVATAIARLEELRKQAAGLGVEFDWLASRLKHASLKLSAEITVIRRLQARKDGIVAVKGGEQ